MILELGNNVFSSEVVVDKDGFVLMNRVEISKGDFDLVPFLKSNRKNILPFLVEVKKL
jgi:hypothetical protein